MIRQLFRLLAPASGWGTPADRRGLIVVVAIFIVLGCGQQRKKDVEILARRPDFEKLVVPGDYAAAAIEATGGLQHWAKVEKVPLRGVVTFYQPDGSFYLTEHRFHVYPWSNSIEVFAREPSGTVAWQFSGGQFGLLPGDERVDVSAMGVSCRDYAEAVLKITTAPVQFLQAGDVFVRGPAPVKMEGLWYYPIERLALPLGAGATPGASAGVKRRDPQGAAVKPYWSKVIYYQNRDTSLVDLLWLAAEQGEASGLRRGDSSLRSEGKFLSVRGYDYKDVEGPRFAGTPKNGVLLPTKIEILRTDAQAVSKDRVAKIDLK